MPEPGFVPFAGAKKSLTLAARVDAAPGGVEVGQQSGGELPLPAGQPVDLDAARRQLPQPGRLVSQVPHEAHHQGVAPQAELQGEGRWHLP